MRRRSRSKTPTPSPRYRRFSRRIIDYLLLVLACVGMWAAFPDQNLPWLALPALAVFIAVIDRVSAPRAWWYGLVFGWGFILPHIWWATISVGGYLPWVALASVEAIAFACFALAANWVTRIRVIDRSIPLSALTIAVLWVGGEQARGRIPFGGFPWGYLAYSQVELPVAHLAPWGSEVTIGIAVVTAAVALRRLVSGRRSAGIDHAHLGYYDSAWARLGGLILAAACIIAPLALPLPASQEEGSIRLGMIQGNVELPADQTFRTPLKVTGNHARVTTEMLDAGEKPDLIVWGENALDRDPRADDDTRQLFTDLVNRSGVPILAGAVRHTATPKARYNDMIVWYPGDEAPRASYTKQLPVPFGEYIPYRDTLAILSKETARVSVDMFPGTEPGLLSITLNDGRVIPVAVGICFEVAYESVTREGVRDGGQLIIIPTNNSSFGYSAESTQQLQMLKLRALSLSRTAIQVSTNGVSAVIRPDGEVRHLTSMYVPHWAVDTIMLRSSLTFSAKYGDMIDALAMGIAAILSLVGGVVTLLQWRNATPRRSQRDNRRSQSRSSQSNSSPPR